MMSRHAAAVLLVVIAAGVRVDDEASATTAAPPASGSGSDFSGPLSAAKAVLNAGGSHEDAAKAAVSTFHGGAVPGYDKNSAGEEMQDSLTKEVSRVQSMDAIMKELQNDVDMSVPKPAVGVASSMGSMAGELAAQAGMPQDKIGTTAGKTALAVGGSTDEAHQTAKMAMEAANSCGAKKLAQAEAQGEAEVEAEKEPEHGSSSLTAAAAAGIDIRVGVELDADAQKGFDEATKIKEEHQKTMEADKDVASPGAPPFVQPAGEGGAADAAKAAAPAANASAALLAAADHKSDAKAPDAKAALVDSSNVTAEAFDAIKKLADSLLPPAA